MIFFTRQGECNQCGECCSDLPWAMRPERIRTWKLENVKKKFPLVKLIPFKNVEDGLIAPRKTHGRIQWGQNIFPYIFTKDGLHKDLEPLGDPNTVSRECPFLVPDNGDGKRPCGLYETSSHDIWENRCREMSDGVPPFKATQEVIDQWFESHPNCSFKYAGDRT